MIFRIKKEQEYKKEPNIFDLNLAPKRITPNDKGNPPLMFHFTGTAWLKKDNGELEHLDEVYFSNLDVNWYDNKGNPHPLQKKYNGRKFLMKSRIELLYDKNNSEMHIKNELTSPLTLGEIGPLDWAGIPAAEQHEWEIGRKLKAFPELKDTYIRPFMKKSASAFAAFTSPYRKLEEIEPYVIYQSFIVLIEEQMGNLSITKKKLTFQQLHDVRARILDVMWGNSDPEDQVVDFDFPKLKVLCRYARYLREAFHELTADREIVERWFKDMGEYLSALILGDSSEWYGYEKNFKDGSNLAIKWDRRKIATGACPALTAQLICYGNRLPKKIHKDHMYQYCRKLVMDHVAFVRELFTYKWELIDGENYGWVYALHNHHGMTLPEAHQACVEGAERSMTDLTDCANLLLSLYDNNKWLSEAVHLMKAHLLGHIMWCNHALPSSSPHDAVVYDCVVLPENDKFDLTGEEQPKYNGSNRMDGWRKIENDSYLWYRMDIGEVQNGSH